MHVIFFLVLLLILDNTGLEVKGLVLLQVLHSPASAVWLWMRHLVMKVLSFFICEVGIITLLTC